jgi:two-component system chemotaxis response regulator CheB
VEKLMIYRPDVILCDIEMPKMNGIGFISRLAPKYPIPIIVISGHEGYKEEALQAGAFAFVSKPKAKTSEDIQRFITYIIEIIRKATVFGEKNPAVDENKERKRIYSKDIIAIGASTGGTQAIFHILRNLDTDLPGIVIVQHIPERFSKMFAERLNEATAFQVKEARSGDTINKGCAYIVHVSRFPHKVGMVCRNAICQYGSGFTGFIRQEILVVLGKVRDVIFYQYVLQSSD